MNMKRLPIMKPRINLPFFPSFSAWDRYLSYCLDNLSSVPNATAFLIELKVSSAIVPPFAYTSSAFLVHLTRNEDPTPKVSDIAITVDVRISVSFQYTTYPITKAVIKVDRLCKVNATFCDIPSCIRLVSPVMRVVVSPAPRLSKNPIFWRRIALK